MTLKPALALSLLTLTAGCSEKSSSELPGAVNAVRIVAADPGEWLSYGRTYDEQRFSPLDAINQDNVSRLGLAWYADLDTARGQEATPLVIDGKIYVTTAWSKAKAYEAVSGKLLWEFDPKVPGETAVKACCDVVNRGMAAWGDKLFFGTLDGRLVALDRASGKPAWTKVTVDQSRPYTITGAPRAINGMVIIGNGGAEMGVRGYVTAYDADSGRELWRFYTVPDKPGRNDEEYLRKAEATWKGEWWKLGGGGTVWDAMAYDPELDLLYIGVGNGSPWNQAIRSPGGGDNLYLSSIVAIRARTGEYVWHFQETPGETWDFTAAQHIILADLQIGGAKRKVLMQAPKNGFFYVLDRTTGQFISGRNFVPVNWASGLDPRTGRPIENPDARYDRTGKPFIGSPGAGGAHNWQPMAWDAKQKLVFIPANLAAYPYFPEKDWKPAAQGFNTGGNMAAGAMPAIKAARDAARAATTGALIAWDPVAQKERWRVSYPGPWNGGLLATAGNLLFQGTASGMFNAYSTHDGRQLWSFPAQTGVMAAPVTFSIGKEQYVAVMAGWGGIWSLATGVLAQKSGPVRNISRLLVFKLGGEAKLPDPPPFNAVPLDPPSLTAKPEVVERGSYLYGRYCGVCHGDAAVGGGVLPDLRRSAVLADGGAWQMIVHDGMLKENGMVAWSKVMSAGEIETIRHYVIKRANEDKALGDK
ncbi:alcohol dehydrogenase (cytochrome c)/quinohemoprotein ethanol dehydrogenase [Novosphingobium sp. CF614]|uniref:PQQ-dependent dehydrogenase, methanol/ethanol family n=1 Tax=Novosphingobium sp. CF614 TaxID=1884364 RepID=UPI0008E5B043|nr:PQQ-dependent dehydrogenase, methanol/ethanol family [Novosphingobium sp. CF614]SFF89773.1 alcohol dehydrogenase (cytochrome c)/quinohemoprotein ethanol dehydrogenase [Novosphingobium sp. CF614]